jgi:hypothetical protein
VNSDGNPIIGENDTILYSTTEPSDPSHWALLTSAVPPFPTYHYHILGEYQDVWYRNGRWNAAGVYSTSTMNISDIVVTRPQ